MFTYRYTKNVSHCYWFIQVSTPIYLQYMQKSPRINVSVSLYFGEIEIQIVER